ncbi:spore germination protein [Bacillus aerolatus]|uniref:Spore germination protein n=2 Tax=Bacillus aerolatus TaxID=2653354 RepID=A0A6I1FMV8_9BACI|nr:spore germination protein [Bacillus aerolatus]KAB7707639.1 spore germination protein [Bacillus aerolatus]
MGFFFKKGNKQPKLKEQYSEETDTAPAKSKDEKESSYYNSETNLHFSIRYISTIVDQDIIQKNILPYLLDKQFASIADVKKILPIEDVQIETNEALIEEKLFNGYLVLKVHTDKQHVAFIAAKEVIVRSLSMPEVETSVIGPKEAFIEAIDQNINLLRIRLPVKELMIEEFTIGSVSKTRTALMYIDDIANMENVNTMRQRLQAIDFDQINDSSYIEQLTADNKNSPFPQFLDTERPDRAAGVLVEGKVVVLVDGSPHALIGPTNLVEFFSSPEDYLFNWITASILRLIRLFAVVFSILITPMYVAVLTYHYELIPKDLTATLITSRQVIPFPPILEALILELTIELLREAGARLPTKIGQTIGIVGGIVIGTASVEAGLTSNVLLILVALAALASFITPVYKMGNAIRFLRFPFLLFAQLLGLLGIVFCLLIVITHLLRLTSLGRPYLEPIYPPRWRDLKDSFIRLSFDKQIRRPSYVQAQKEIRFNPKHQKRRHDIEE